MQPTVPERKREAKPPQSNPPSSSEGAASSGWQKILLRPEEGWTTFLFLGFVIYSAVWSIQAMNWVRGLDILTWTTALGLVLGFVASKQSKIPALLLHVLLMGVGIFFAFWMTAVANHASLGGLWTHFTAWLTKSFTPNTPTDDDVMFLLFLAVLSCILAYVSVWLVARTRRPWLVILATSIVLLINLSFTPDGNLIYLTMFLLAGLLLLVRFHLSELFRRWKRRSMRWTADLGWDFMVAGMVFSVFLLVFGWILPEAGPNQSLSNVWNAVSNPWVSAQQLWASLFQVTGGPGTGAYFGDQLQLKGSVNLPNQVILTYTTRSEGPYLIAVTQDYFDGHTWSSTDNTTQKFDARQDLTVNKSSYTQVTQTIHLVTPPVGSPNQFIFAMADPLNFSIPVGITQDGSGATSWYGRDPLVGGENYTVTSDVSTADEDSLRQVPLPKDAPGSTFLYPSDLLSRYTQVPGDLANDPQMQALVSQWTAGQTTMYDMAQAIETHLRSGYQYSLRNDDPPGNEDAVTWFLLQSKKGFCTFFASAMVMLARLLGIPARVASGYTAGSYENTGHYVVKGTDAHTWAQIYFAKYGWISFEPTASFPTAARPVPSVTPSVTPTTGPGSTPVPSITPKTKGGQTGPQGGSDLHSTQSQQSELGVWLLFGAGGALSVLVLLFGTTSLWWRRLFRGLSPVAQTFGRVTLLAGWAGIKPRSTQTPYEYIGELEGRLPLQAGWLHRLGELYVEERWGAHNRNEGALAELRLIWARLRGTLVRAVLRRSRLHLLHWRRIRGLPRRKAGR